MNLTVLVSSPNDQDDAASAVIRAIEKIDRTLRPMGHSIGSVYWKENISTGRGARAQSVINDQIKSCDAIIAIFGARIGTPTGDHLSGTSEELSGFLARSRKGGTAYDVHVFFSTHYDESIYNIDPNQLLEVIKLRTTLNEKGVHYAEFSSIEDLETLTHTAIGNLIGKNKSGGPAIDDQLLIAFEEYGFDDALNEGGAYLAKASESLDQITRWSNRASTALNDASRRAQNTKIESLARAQLIADFCNVGESASTDLEPICKDLIQNIHKAYALHTLAFTIANEDSLGIDQGEEWGHLSDIAEGSAQALRSFVETLKETRAIFGNMPRLNRDVIRAKKAITSVYDRLIMELSLAIEKSDETNEQIHRLVNRPPYSPAST